MGTLQREKILNSKVLCPFQREINPEEMNLLSS